MSTNKHIVIVAGEESGDQHASRFVSILKSSHPDWRFSGIGGRHLEKSGMPLLVNLARFGVTGIVEVVKNFSILRKAYKLIQKHILSSRPDLIVLVDSPAFNLRLARFIKKQIDIPILYFIGPQIWAWKAGRIHQIKANVNHMAVILPFEKALYQRAGVPVSYVGHPLTEILPVAFDKPALRASLHLPADKKIVALLPGSRQNEIDRHMPVLVAVIQQLCRIYPDIHFVLPIAGTLNQTIIDSFLPSEPLPLQLFDQQAQQLIQASDAVIVASGTASLECALLGTPGCIIYKTSAVTAMMARRFIKIPYLGLANIIQNDIVMPEFLQENCNPKTIAQYIQRLLTDKDVHQKMIAAMAALKSNLSLTAADQSVSQLIETMISDQDSLVSNNQKKSICH